MEDRELRMLCADFSASFALTFAFFAVKKAFVQLVLADYADLIADFRRRLLRGSS
jgi:hypothetical protein